MTQYNTLNIKLSNSQLCKLKSGIKNGTEVTLKLYWWFWWWEFIVKLLFSSMQVPKLHKAFANNSLAKIKLSKIQLHRIRHSLGFLVRILGPLLKTGLPLSKNVLKPLVKNILIPLGLIATASATDRATHKKMFGSGITTFISHEYKK